jgi:hypothetical protein
MAALMAPLSEADRKTLVRLLLTISRQASSSRPDVPVAIAS